MAPSPVAQKVQRTKPCTVAAVLGIIYITEYVHQQHFLWGEIAGSDFPCVAKKVSRFVIFSMKKSAFLKGLKGSL